MEGLGESSGYLGSVNEDGDAFWILQIIAMWKKKCRVSHLLCLISHYTWNEEAEYIGGVEDGIPKLEGFGGE